jgi:mediator of RNA polymerase II transcription subunit 7
MNPVTEPPKISSVFPNPPPLYHSFTHANVSSIAALRRAQYHQQHHHHHAASAATTAASGPRSAAAAVDPATPLRIPNVPAPLLNLQPPAEPADGRWRVFGDQYSLDDKLPSLEDQSIERLVPQSGGGKDGEIDRDVKHLDRAFQLKKLAKSQLLNFLELVGILSHAPDDVCHPQVCSCISMPTTCSTIEM